MIKIKSVNVSWSSLVEEKSASRSWLIRVKKFSQNPTDSMLCSATVWLMDVSTLCILNIWSSGLHKSIRKLCMGDRYNDVSSLHSYNCDWATDLTTTLGLLHNFFIVCLNIGNSNQFNFTCSILLHTLVTQVLANNVDSLNTTSLTTVECGHNCCSQQFCNFITSKDERQDEILSPDLVRCLHLSAVCLPATCLIWCLFISLNFNLLNFN